ncbi:MAG TPA: NAD(P)-binding protein, partial [Patescibacteria group bacterium]|nr:NAD(P)-binding protein [Patescibacteria group bacterium]
MATLYDLIIVGAGPAGLTAGILSAERHLNTLVLEAEKKPGGQLTSLYP